MDREGTNPKDAFLIGWDFGFEEPIRDGDSGSRGGRNGSIETDGDMRHVVATLDERVFGVSFFHGSDSSIGSLPGGKEMGSFAVSPEGCEHPPVVNLGRPLSSKERNEGIVSGKEDLRTKSGRVDVLMKENRGYVSLELKCVRHESSSSTSPPETMRVPAVQVKESTRSESLRDAADFLYSQLLETSKEIERKYEEERERLKSSKKSREAIGVQLYTQQSRLKHLARQAVEFATKTRDVQNQEERSRRSIQSLGEKTKRVREELEKEMVLFKEEMEELQLLEAAQFQMDMERKVLKDQVNHAKLNTSTVGKIITCNESEKRKSTYLLQKQVSRLANIEEEAQMTQLHTEAQRLEIQIAMSAMAHLSCQIERVIDKRNHFSGHWRSILVENEKQAEAILMAQDTLHSRRNERRCLRGDIARLEKLLEDSACKREYIVATIVKKDKMIEGIDEDIKRQQKEEERCSARVACIRQSIAGIRDEISMLLQEKERLSSILREKQDQVASTSFSLKELVERDRAFAEEHASCKATSRHASESIHGLLERMEQVQDEIVRCEGELSLQSSRRETLQSSVERDRNQLKCANDAIEQKGKCYDAQCVRFQAGISRVEKLTSELLVREQHLQKILNGRREEDAGPLESTIAHLKLEIVEKSKQYSEQQKLCRVRRAALLKREEEISTASEKLHALQKRKRDLLLDSRTLVEEASQIRHDLVVAEEDLEAGSRKLLRMREEIHRSKEKQNHVEKETAVLKLTMQSIFEENSKALSRMDAKLSANESLMEDLTKKSARKEGELIELEREIELEKETQSAILPLLKNDKEESLSREVRKLKNEWERLQKVHSRHQDDLRRLISKRNVFVGCPALENRKEEAWKRQKRHLQKELQRLRRTLRNEGECLSRLESERQKIQRDIEATRDESRSILDDIDGSRSRVKELRSKKESILNRVVHLQDLHRRSSRRKHLASS